jgi:hypothetical protein
MAFYFAGYRMRVLSSLALANALCVASACVTGPKDSLSGDWGGGGLFLSLRQSGSVVRGMAGATPCLPTSVSGSIHGSDFTLMIDTGAIATNYTGTFVNPSAIAIREVADANVNLGTIPLTKLSSFPPEKRTS